MSERNDIKIKNFYCSKHGEVKPDVHPSCPLCHKEKPTQGKTKKPPTSVTASEHTESIPPEKPIEEWEENFYALKSVREIDGLMQDGDSSWLPEIVTFTRHLLKEEREKALQANASVGYEMGAKAALQELRKEVEKMRVYGKDDGPVVSLEGNIQRHLLFQHIESTNKIVDAALNLIDARMK